MAIKKIEFTGLTATGFTYTAMGGIRFYDASGSLISSGAIISNTRTAGETENFKVTATSTYTGNDYYYVVYAFDTARPQTGGIGADRCYWLTSGDNQTLTCEFKTPLTTLGKIEFVPCPDPSHTNRGVDQDFTINVYNENDNLLQSYTVTPISANDTVQTLQTPELTTQDAISGSLSVSVLFKNTLTVQYQVMPDLSASITVNPTNTMEGQVNILQRFKNTMTAQYQVMPDLPASLTVNPTNTMDGQVNIEPPPRETQELEAIKDAMLRETRPTLNYGTTTTISVGYQLSEDGRYRGLFQFDLSSIPADVTIEKAYLRLRTPGSHDVAQDIAVYGVKNSWVETGVTWKSHPEIDSSPLDTQTAEPGKAYVELDVTSIVAEWYRGTRENHGLLVKASPETRDQLIQFYAREYGDPAHSPTLVVTYILPVYSDGSWIDSSITVHRDYVIDSNDLSATLDVFAYLDDNDLSASVAVQEHATSDVDSRIAVSTPDLSSSATVPYHNDLGASISARVTAEDDLAASIIASKPDLPSQIGVAHHDDLIATLGVRAPGSADLPATINARQTTRADLNAEIKAINGPNDLAGTITVTGGFFRATLFVSYTEDLPASLEVPLHLGSKYLWASIAVRVEKAANLEASASVVNGPNDIPSTIRVASGNLGGSLDVTKTKDLEAVLAVTDYENIPGTIAVRQTTAEDFDGSISVYGGPNDLPAEVRVISDWMRASIAVRYPGYDVLEMSMTARQLDISELESTLQVGSPGSEIPGNISVVYCNDLPATITARRWGESNIDGSISARQTEDVSISGHLTVKQEDASDLPSDLDVEVWDENHVYGYIAVRRDDGRADLNAQLGVKTTDDLSASINVGEVEAGDLVSSLFVMRGEILPAWLTVHRGWDLASTLTVTEHDSIDGSVSVKRYRQIPGYLRVRRTVEDDIAGDIAVTKPELASKFVVSRGSQPGSIVVRQDEDSDLRATAVISQPNLGSRVGISRRALPATITVEAPYETKDLHSTITVVSWRAFVDELYDLLPPVLKKDPKGDR